MLEAVSGGIMRRALPLSVLLLAAPLAAGRPMTIADMFKVARVAAPALSSTGDVAYQVGVPDLDANKVRTRLWLRRAGEAAPAILDLGEGSQSAPRFSPDGKQLSFEQGGQLW